MKLKQKPRDEVGPNPGGGGSLKCTASCRSGPAPPCGLLLLQQSLSDAFPYTHYCVKFESGLLHIDGMEKRVWTECLFDLRRQQHQEKVIIRKMLLHFVVGCYINTSESNMSALTLFLT